MDKELELFLLQARVKEETIQNLVKDEVGFVSIDIDQNDWKSLFYSAPVHKLIITTSRAKKNPG